MLNEFSALLRKHRENAGFSRNYLAQIAGVDPSYLTRIEHGDREPPRVSIVHCLGSALRLHGMELNTFVVTAGYAPLITAGEGGWDITLQVVLEVLVNPALTEEEHLEYRRLIEVISRRYQETAGG